MADETKAPEQRKPLEYKDKNGKQVIVGSVILVPCVVTALGGDKQPIIHIATRDGYGRRPTNVRAGFWAEPGQIEVAAE